MTRAARSMMATGGAAMLMLAAGLGPAGCASSATRTATAENESACRDAKGGTITTPNTVCVMVNEDPVNPSVTPVEWKGQKYGLCCNGCRGKWEALSPTEKDAAVAKAVAASKH